MCCPRPLSFGFPGTAMMPYLQFDSYSMLHYPFFPPISLSNMYAISSAASFWPWWTSQHPTVQAPNSVSSSSAITETTTSEPSTLMEEKSSTQPWIFYGSEATSTTTASPSTTTSPWWVPEPTSTTPKPSITTSPWWTPESTTTSLAAQSILATTSAPNPFRSTCGAGPYRIDERIVGGTSAAKNAWPFAVSSK